MAAGTFLIVLVVLAIAYRPAGKSLPLPGAVVQGSATATPAAAAPGQVLGAGSAAPEFDPRTEWPLTALRASALWTVSEGAGVTVAVVDTGVDASQRDLVGVVMEVIGKPGDQSTDSHGTAIAGLIAGRGSTSDPAAHVAGLAPLARLIDVRVTTQAADVTPAALATGIRAAAMAGARVINVSLTVPHDDARKDIGHAVAFAQSRGSLIVASAGPAGTAAYPGVLPDVLVVGGVRQDGQRLTGLAAYSGHPVVYAPGADLDSTAEDGNAVGGTGGYVQGITGDDYATAYVSATAALILSVEPTFSPDKVGTLIAAEGASSPGTLDPLTIMTALGLYKPPPATPSNSARPSLPGSASASVRALPGTDLGSPLYYYGIAALVLLIGIAALLGVWLRYRDGGGSGPSGPRRPDLTSSGWDLPW